MSWTIRVCSSSFARNVNAEATTKVTASRITSDIYHTVVQLAAQSQTGSSGNNDAERIAQKLVSALLS